MNIAAQDGMSDLRLDHCQASSHIPLTHLDGCRSVSYKWVNGWMDGDGWGEV